MVSVALRAWSLIALFAGMNGVRIDRGVRVLLVWGLLGSASLSLCAALREDHAVAYMVFSWAFYYVGNGILLGTAARPWLIRRLGEERAYAGYELVCGLMFINIGLAHGVAYEQAEGSLAIPAALLWPSVVVLTVAGFGVKFWATAVVGLDTYYYRDCFLGRKIGEFSCRGPYRVMKNPMYGVGNLHAYAGALLMQSGWGLLFAALCHVSIFAFYRVVEYPFIRRTYLDGGADLAPPAAPVG